MATEAVPVSARVPDRENSTFLKAISYLPIVGLVSTLVIDIVLANKIYGDDADDKSRLIELIKLKNEYKKAKIVSSLLSAALIVAQVALGFFPVAVGLILTGLCLYSAKQANDAIYENNQLLTQMADPDCEYMEGPVY